MPFEFSRIMQETLGDLPFVQIFIDDITIHSDSIETHLNHIITVLTRLKEADLKINIEKCTFITEELNILGHIISKNKIKMDPAKINSIKNRLHIKNIKHLQSFLGLTNYYRKFVHSYAKIVKPLVKLLENNQPFIWSTDCEHAFISLKNKLTAYPILNSPDLNKQFTLHTDASGYAIGAILTQINNNGGVVIAYASRILKANEINFGITEKECLALVWAIKHFRYYLANIKIKVITDHSALKWLSTLKDPTGRLARWNIYLQAYDLEIIHRAGVKHTNADALSRPVLEINQIEETDTDGDPDSILSLDPYDNEQLLHYFKFGRHMKDLSKKSIRKINKLIQKFQFKNNELFYLTKFDRYKKYPRKEERASIIAAAHNLGHFKTKATYNKIKVTHYWKQMINDITNYIKKCTICIRADAVRPIHHAALALDVTGIFERVGIDLSFGYPTTVDGFKGILVLIEYLSGYVMIYPIKSKSAEEIAKLLKNYISIFSPPKSILSDLGNEFNNSIIDELTSNLNIDHKVTAGWNPDRH